jgi:ribosomal protein L30
MAKLRISYTKSAIGYSTLQKETIRSLGLRKLNSVVVHDDTAVIRGMIFKVQHLVQVEELAEADTAPKQSSITTQVRAGTRKQPGKAPKASTAEPAREDRASEVDDLSLIEGVGPKIAEILQGAGISTFAALAKSDVERLNGILEEANLHMAVPDTWPEQAALAADGKWEELKELQERLTGGRRSE